MFQLQPASKRAGEEDPGQAPGEGARAQLPSATGLANKGLIQRPGAEAGAAWERVSERRAPGMRAADCSAHTRGGGGLQHRAVRGNTG